MTSIRRDVLVAVPVAFHADGALDLEGSRRILQHCTSSRVDGVFVLGTTGEFPSLSVAERGELVRLTMAEVTDKRVVVHVGAASLREVLVLLDQAREAGAREVAVITPYFLEVTDAAVTDFYRAVSEAADGIDVYVYVFRQRTGKTISPELLTRLLELPNVVGAKISGESPERVAEYRAAVGPEPRIYTGGDEDLGRVETFGAQGVVSGTAAVFPHVFTDLVQAVADGDEGAVPEAERRVRQAVALLQGDMARMKVALAAQGVAAGTVRMAIEQPSASERSEIEAAVRDLTER